MAEFALFVLMFSLAIVGISLLVLLRRRRSLYPIPSRELAVDRAGVLGDGLSASGNRRRKTGRKHRSGSSSRSRRQERPRREQPVSQPPSAERYVVAEEDQALESVATGVIIHHNHVLYANPKAAALRGMRQDDLIGQSVVSLFAPDDRGVTADRFEQQLGGDGTTVPYVARMLDRSGGHVEVECTDALIHRNGLPVIMTTVLPLSETSAAPSESETAPTAARASMTLSSLTDGVINTDDSGIVHYMNPAARSLLALTNGTDEQQRLIELVRFVDETDHKPLPDPVERCLRDRCRVHLGRAALMVTGDDTEHSIDLTVTPMLGPNGTLRGTVILMRDVTELRGMTRQMSYEASHDPLTGLLNRREFEQRLDEALGNTSESSPDHVLCYLDLDRFKAVNDTCGHMAGDNLLRQLASLIREKVRDSDSVARLGGDEFGVLLSTCPLDKARQIADDVCNAVEDHRFVWQDKIFSVSVSIGLVEFGASSGSLEDVMSAADSACYVAKQRGRSRVHVYSAKDEALARHRGEIAWLQQLQGALKDDTFRLVAQPIVAAGRSDGGGPACELLLRLSDRQGAEVSPRAFGDSARRYHLMPRIDRWVVQHALSAIDSGVLRLPPGRRCTLNLSGQTMGDPTFLEYVVECLDASGVTGDQLCFEVTETSVISNLAYAQRFIDVLHGFNCHFALDDFGSGMGSFANLRKLRMDYIKIDGSYTRNLGDDTVSQAMVGAMIKLARSLDIRVVAEQVESQSALDAVRGMGIDFVQGHVIGEPAPIGA
jgi:diguanylate cyclase (GGDEF)-like protein/PAS domain S-box-containing protein